METIITYDISAKHVEFKNEMKKLGYQDKIKTDGVKQDNNYENDLIDIISTDFAAGKSDSMLEAIQHAALEEKLVGLAKAVNQATARVAEVLPRLAPNLGLLKKSYTADIVITEYPALKNVERVYIGGKLAAKDGKVIR